jgi:TonB family protein
MQWKPASFHDHATQVNSVLAFAFTTKIQAPAGQDASSQNTEGVSGASAVRLPSEVQAGAKIGGVPPHYPPIARQSHIQGTVVLRAIIGKDGSIKNLRMLDSPDSSLTEAAMNAVQTWQYRPYLLRGQPVEVQTTISVNFALGH